MASKPSTQLATKDPAAGAVVPKLEIGKSTGLVARIAARFSIDPEKMLETLKATAFRQRPPRDNKPAVVVTNEHMLMLLVIAEQYHLNPFTREIYAFPQDGGIVPIIPIDGWLRIVNEHPQFDYMEIRVPPDDCERDDFWTECEIKRKDRARPIVIREWFKECYRDTDPWNSHGRRMTRHKAIIQTARVSFGFAGVFDPDEGERIFAAAIDVTPKKEPGKPLTREPVARAAPDDPVISADQVTAIHDKLHEEGVDRSRFLAEFQIGSVDDLMASNYDKGMALIDTLSKGE
jgi:RecT family